MSVCHSLPGDCRTDAPRISTPDQKGGECAIVPGKIGDLGSKVFVTPYNVTYQRPGVTVREFNHAGLRLPQKREFLGPEFFNAGCATLYGNSRFGGGESSAHDSMATEAMFDYNFSAQPYYTGNNFPCENAGAKCASANSALGWMLNKNGQLLWQSQDAAAANQRCGMRN
jgi:hypothetical protein